MEALLIVVAELMAIPLFVATALLLELAGGALIGLGQLLALPGTDRKRKPSLLRRWWRRAVWTLTGMLGLMLATLVFIDLVLYEQGLRLLLEHVENRSGVDLCFERARGNIFTGVVHLEGVTVRHSNGADLDLSIDSVDIDIAMLRIFESAVPITELQLRGVRGSITRRHTEQLGTSHGSRRFIVEKLAIEGLTIDFEDLAGAPVRSLPLAVELLELAPLRSDHALLDLLCHTRVRGRTRGVVFSADPGAWIVRQIPLGPASTRLGPLGKWLRGGQLDIGLSCLDDQADPLTLRVDLGLSHLWLGAREEFQLTRQGESGRRRLVARVTSALEHLGPRLDLQLDLKLERGHLVGVTSAAQIGLWELGVHHYNLQLGQRLGLDQDDLSLLGIGSRAAAIVQRHFHSPDQAPPR